MASIRTRDRKDGSRYSQVLYRAGGKQTSLSFDDHKKAVRFKTLVEKYGPDEAERIYNIERQQIHEPTVAEYCRTHIDSLTGVEPGTIVSYERYLKNDITDSIGGLPLSAVSEATVSEWVKALAKRTEVVTGKDGEPVIDPRTGRPKKRTITNSGKTIANKHGFLSGVFKSAVRAGLVPTNPCEHTRLPRTDDREEKVFLSQEAFAQLLEDIPDKWRPLTLWLVATGMRFGEATALTVGDVSPTDGTCRIAKAWKYTGTSEARLAYPKSKKSRRTINVAPQALAVVDLSRPKSELLFVDPDRGGRVTYPRFRHDGWKRAAAKLEPSPSPHDLRHTCASWMIAAGTPLPVVQAHLGHESINTTIAVYTHIDRRQAAAAAEAISRMLSPAKTEQPSPKG